MKRGVRSIVVFGYLLYHSVLLGKLRSISEGVSPGETGSRLSREWIQLCILEGETEPESVETE